MPLAGSEVYCNAANKNRDLVSEAEKKIRDQREEIKKMELEIKQRRRDISQQQRNCKAWVRIDNTVPLETKAFTFQGLSGGRKSRRKSKKSRKSRRKSRK
jgi:hypothetical protein